MPAVLAEEGNSPEIFVNSWNESYKHIQEIQEKLYVLKRNKIGIRDYMALYKVTKEKATKVLNKIGGKGIEVFQGNLLFFSEKKNMVQIVLNAPGYEKIEVFDIESNRFYPFAQYDRAASTEQYFVRNDTIYHMVFDEQSWLLFQKNNTEEVLLLKCNSVLDSPYPSFLLLSADKWNQWIPWWKTKVQIYDFASGSIFETENTLSLSKVSMFFQGVLQGKKLYYLSPEGLNMWNFNTNTDTNVIYQPKHEYEKFSLSKNHAIFYYGDSRGYFADYYDLITGQLLKKYELTFYPLDVCLMDNTMFLYDFYSARIEHIDLFTGEKRFIDIE